MAGKITVSLPDDVLDRLNSDLDYGDNRSAIVAEALCDYYGLEVEA